jgi:hypothetical protein
VPARRAAKLAPAFAWDAAIGQDRHGGGGAQLPGRDLAHEGVGAALDPLGAEHDGGVPGEGGCQLGQHPAQGLGRRHHQHRPGLGEVGRAGGDGDAAVQGHAGHDVTLWLRDPEAAAAALARAVPQAPPPTTPIRLMRWSLAM